MQQYNDGNDYFNQSRIHQQNTLQNVNEQSFNYKINIFKASIEALQKKALNLEKVIRQSKKDENGDLLVDSQKLQIFGQQIELMNLIDQLNSIISDIDCESEQYKFLSKYISDEDQNQVIKQILYFDKNSISQREIIKFNQKEMKKHEFIIVCEGFYKVKQNIFKTNGVIFNDLGNLRCDYLENQYFYSQKQIMHSSNKTAHKNLKVLGSYYDDEESTLNNENSNQLQQNQFIRENQQVQAQQIRSHGNQQQIQIQENQHISEFEVEIAKIRAEQIKEIASVMNGLKDLSEEQARYVQQQQEQLQEVSNQQDDVLLKSAEAGEQLKQAALIKQKGNRNKFTMGFAAVAGIAGTIASGGTLLIGVVAGAIGGAVGYKVGGKTNNKSLKNIQFHRPGEDNQQENDNQNNQIEEEKQQNE